MFSSFCVENVFSKIFNFPILENQKFQIRTSIIAQDTQQESSQSLGKMSVK